MANRDNQSFSCVDADARRRDARRTTPIDSQKIVSLNRRDPATRARRPSVVRRCLTFVVSCLGNAEAHSRHFATRRHARASVRASRERVNQKKHKRRITRINQPPTEHTPRDADGTHTPR